MADIGPRCAGLIQASEGLALAGIAGAVPADRAIVELGSHTGLSTCWMARAASRRMRAHVTAIDPWGDPRPGSEDDPFALQTGDGALARFRQNVTDERLWPSITPLRTTSIEAAGIWAKPVGLLFVDAVHTFDAVRDDFLAWAPFVVQGGWLALHDYTREPDHPYAGVARAVDEVILPTGDWEERGVFGNLWMALRTR